ncbi:RsiW-degrading membrane proteinase PrsW (M82 family) [Nocardia tenerifensis]|uniref:RsiW-degrading membrane proteinase PrsW (M82 family) n=1 Tax=Nocardia tenerifensis TaxID=228006 RepID=A0A318KRS6_9NOCA|nr:PrsW family intramembrane metalloprotease [Nocardia tenerifensis]PXX65647.1 RsiW-degrading membrane proteinase PrsW (M82 family) [Nocardia tenerifensis]
MRWFQPRSALFWVYWIVALLGVVGLVLQLAPVAVLTWRDILVGLPFALLTMLVFGWVILHSDRLRARQRIRTPLLMGFLWGALAGPGIAMFANDHNMRIIQNLAGDAFAIDWQAPISAAIVEEAIKGVGVFAVAWLARPLLDRPMHGLLLGGCTGLGFQVVENVTYSANAGLLSAQYNPANAMLVGALRLFTGVTSHWMLTSLAGIGIVLAVARADWPGRRRVQVLAMFYLLGAALHFGWDAPSPASVPIGSIVTRTLLYVLIFAVVYVWVVRTEREWFREVVDWAVSRGIAPAGELSTLISRRSRRRARAAERRNGRTDGRAQRQRQRVLLDWVQETGARSGIRVPA